MTRRPFPILFATLGVGCLLSAAEDVPAAEARPNILMIAIDDLRPMLGCYGDERAKTPNIDRLAEQGMLFERAYCNYAKCGPSRLSLMTGLRPEEIRVVGHGDKDVTAFRDRRADATTLARWFTDHGYETRSFGKIDHDGWQQEEDWSAPPSPGREREMWEIVDPDDPSGDTIVADRLACPVMQAYDVPDDHLFAGRMTSEVVDLLAEAGEEKPFFYAVGYRRPHLPFVAPKKYFDLHAPDESWLASNQAPPREAPPLAWFNSDGYVATADRLGHEMPVHPDREEARLWNGFELRSYLGAPVKGLVGEKTQLDLVHAYAACVSYVDAQVGRLLDGLEDRGLRDNTIVLLWSDHGWHLGEMSAWSKMTNYEIATRVPFIVSVPGKPTGRTRSFAELVDVYPTLCDLAGLERPEHLQGDVLTPVLDEGGNAVKDAVFHEHARYRGKFLGRAVRTNRYRYCEWTDVDGAVVARELYDLENDPDETVNVAGNEPALVAEAAARLEKGD
ncbi:MAG: sulfatase [Verrucomicrobiales bacterium]